MSLSTPHVLGTTLALLSVLLTGCATSTVRDPLPLVMQASDTAETYEPESNFTPVVRYGRYTLVELVPDAVQRDLLLQVVDIAMPDTLHTTVGDALNYVLLRSGYGLCGKADVQALHVMPLPAAHYRLGPLVLRDVLLTLAGPAWDLQVDDGARQVCFVRVAPPTLHLEGPPRPEPDGVSAARTFPIATEGQP
nr:PilL N-terminal domain-containing protein [Xanthomonas arboricola]